MSELSYEHRIEPNFGDEVSKATGEMSLALKGMLEKYRNDKHCKLNANDMVADLETLEIMIEDIMTEDIKGNTI